MSAGGWIQLSVTCSPNMCFYFFKEIAINIRKNCYSLSHSRKLVKFINKILCDDMNMIVIIQETM